MKRALTELTNSKSGKDRKSEKEDQNERTLLIKQLKVHANNTKDFDLKYDIIKCIETLEGKENQEISDLKEYMKEILKERDEIFKEKCELICELDYFREFANKK